MRQIAAILHATICIALIVATIHILCIAIIATIVLLSISLVIALLVPTIVLLRWRLPVLPLHRSLLLLRLAVVGSPRRFICRLLIVGHCPVVVLSMGGTGVVKRRRSPDLAETCPPKTQKVR